MNQRMKNRIIRDCWPFIVRGDSPFKFLKRAWRTFDWSYIVFRYKKSGIKFFFDREYRVTVRRKEHNLKARAKYGSGFLSRRKEIRRKLMARDGMGCNKCYIVNKPLTIDHIVPRFKGGTNGYMNLQLLCEPCHVKKTARENPNPDRRFGLSTHVD